MVVEKDAAVGWRVRVFWEGDEEWFDGVVKKYSSQSGYYVEYDDGEEQWEVEDPKIFEFVSKQQTPSSLEDAQLLLATQDDTHRDEEGEVQRPERPKWSAQPPPSTNDEYGEDAYEDDHDHDDGTEAVEREASVRSADSPTPEAESPIKRPISKQPATAPSKQPRDPTKYVKSGVFFRDPETLRDTKAALQKESHTLKKQYDALTVQLQQKEQASVGLKRELHGLKAQVSLASLTGHTGKSSASRATPKTARDWAELVLAQKSAHRSMRQELSEKQSQLTQKRATLQQMDAQKLQLQAKLGRVPRKDLSSLVDVEMEITQLMSEKRTLEMQLAQVSTSTGRVVPGALKEKEAEKSSTVDAKMELGQELRKLEKKITRVSDEVDQWRLSYEKENARIQPVKTRLASLQQQLARYESSQVLLRSVFLRLDRDGNGKISLDPAVDAMALLAPETEKLTREEMKTAVSEVAAKGMDSSTTEDLDFATFTQCFNCIFPKS